MSRTDKFVPKISPIEAPIRGPSRNRPRPIATVEATLAVASVKTSKFKMFKTFGKLRFSRNDFRKILSK